ncbi:MAG: conjugal transfer protein TraE, partial [Lachnospiraceae bacterium]|nr:conjugal transfer protein TraE [Lachnospiraceae bacterium]
MPEGLTREEKKEVKKIIEEARRKHTVPNTAQESIPFERMFKDGICRVTDDYYTKTIQFQDINYQLALQEDKAEIFDEWCSFLNFFDSTVHFELSFMNMVTDMDEFRAGIAIPHQKDSFNSVRDEYSSMLFHQMEA